MDQVLELQGSIYLALKLYNEHGVDAEKSLFVYEGKVASQRKKAERTVRSDTFYDFKKYN